ncbi:MAG: PLP-dependent aminotransferase family protein, partial [Actinomycetota bacterium]
GAGAVLVTPSHQFPLGVTMSAGRRTALVEWARDGDRWIVEDDYDGEFRYDRQPLGSLQGLAPDRVLYAGTASKVLAPGLRLAWVVVPPGLRRTMAAVTHLRAGVGTVDQLALADFIGHGELDRHLRRVRALYLDRHRQLAAAIAAEVDWLVPRSSVAAGLHLTMTLAGLPDGAGERVRVEERLVTTAAAADIGVFGLAPHWLGPATEHGLVIGYSRPPQHGYAHSLERLVAWLTSFRFED